MAGIDFKTPFDDDAHSLSEGSMARFFRMRKWMLLSSFFLSAVTSEWLDYSAFVDLFFLSGLEKSTAQIALTIICGYFLIQAILLSIQIRATYWDTLEARVATIQMHNSDEAEKALAASATQLESVQKRRHDHNNEKMRLAAIEERRRNPRPPLSINELLEKAALEKANPDEHEEQEEEEEEEIVAVEDVDIRFFSKSIERAYKKAKTEHDEAVERLVRLEKLNTDKKLQMTATEFCLDSIRILPAVLALATVFVFQGLVPVFSRPANPTTESAQSAQSAQPESPLVNDSAGQNQAAPESQTQSQPSPPAPPLSDAPAETSEAP